MRYPYVLLLGCLMLCAALDGQSQSSKTFTYTGAFEKYIVPTTGWYLLEAYGAQGGANGDSSKQGGKGARIQARVRLKAGDTLQIGVGGMGRKGKPQESNSMTVGGGGGGGASSIVRVRNSAASNKEDRYEPLIFASGGGGAIKVIDGYSEGPDHYIWESDLQKENPNCQGGYVLYLATDVLSGSGGGYCSDGINLNTPGSSGQGYLNGNAGGNMNEPGGGGWGGGGQGFASESAPTPKFTAGGLGWGGGGGGFTGGNVVTVVERWQPDPGDSPKAAAGSGRA